MTLRQRGMSQTAIAKQMGMGQSTVGNWLAGGVYPETTRGPYVSRLDPYLPYLFQRWESGCHNMVRLHSRPLKMMPQPLFVALKQRQMNACLQRAALISLLFVDCMCISLFVALPSLLC
jgi:hypothetical protein